MVEIILLFPLFGIGVLMISPREEEERLWRIGLEWSLLTLTGAIVWWATVKSGGEYQIRGVCKWIPEAEPNIGGIVLGGDGVSVLMVLLTAVLIPICVIISEKGIKILVKEYVVCIMAVEALLIGVFSVYDLVVFYVFFEGTLIPMFIVIGVWGGRQEKVQAAYYFFLYTFSGSVLMLLGLVALYSYAGTTDYQALCSVSLDYKVQVYVFVCLYLGLAVKLPQMPFHIWLPQAHVEAPVAGSVLLAGILLKLGGYGLVRFSWPMLPEASVFFSPLVVVLSVLGIVYGSLTTCRQIDLKRIIAYSSVAHMGLITLSLFSNTLVGLVGSVFMMLSHGLVSPALFIAVTILYERFRTRLVKYYRGLVVAMPLYTVIFLVLTLANASVPLSSSFVGEFMCLLGAWEYSIVGSVLGATGIVLSAGYSLYLYNRICFGMFSQYLGFPRDLSRREYYSIVPLVGLIIILGVFPWVVSDDVKGCLSNYE